MKIGRLLVLIATLVLSNSGVLAQGVPIGNGLYACDGAAQAGPCQPDVDDAPAIQSVRWQDRWGAIAADENAVYGIVADMSSKHQAKKAAIAECKKRGGESCEIQLAYYNQCAVVIAGTTGSNVSHAATEEEAASTGISNCEKVDGEGACRVYYSGCSLPVKAQ